MRQLRKLIPAFLWQWDQRLLQERPRLWSTRVHLHLWFLLLCNALALGLGLLINVHHRRFPDPEELFLYMLVPTIAYAAFWVHRVVRFSAEKRFGERPRFAEAGEFLVLWASALLTLTIPTTLALTVGLRIAALTPDARFAAEVDLLSGQMGWIYGRTEHYDFDLPFVDDEPDHAEATVEAARQAEAERVPQGAGSHRFFRSIAEYRLRNDHEQRRTHTDVPALHDIYEGYIYRGNHAMNREDSASFDPDTAAVLHAKADSIERSFPLLLVDHGELRPFCRTVHLKGDSLLEAEYIARVERGEPMDQAAMEQALAVAARYSARVRPIGAEQVAREFAERRPSTSGIESCRRQLARIAKAKDLRYFFVDAKEYLYAIVLLSFGITVLITAFKRIHWQPFLIAIITAAVVPILVLVLALILEHDVIPANDDEIMVHTHWLIAVGLFASLLSIPRLKAYRTSRAVMVLLANVVAPFFALFTLAILHEEFDVFGQDALRERIAAIAYADSDDLRLPALEEQADALRALISRVMLGALWGGVALYVLALHPLFARLYARLMALPERR